MDDIVQAQDEQRTKRAFISFLSTAFGVDQTMANADGYAVNQPRQYQTIGPSGVVGVEGTSQNTAQASVMGSPLVLILLGAGLVYLVLQK